MMKKTIIIAEAGVNHNGEYELAKQLIDAAAAAGADYVKFQTFKAEKLATQNAGLAKYQEINIKQSEVSQREMLRKLELPADWHKKLADYAKSKSITFVSTGFDEESVDLLDNIGVPFFKIPSGEITNKPYLEHIAKKGKPVILSTGMATLDEVSAALQVLTQNGLRKKDVCVLHCTTDYPASFNDVNLMAMLTIRDQLGVEVGYSDHTLGIEVPIAAVALGATVIEKHLTISRSLPGPDHAASLESQELKRMVQSIRNVELALAGNGKKVPTRAEIGNLAVARKSLHFNKDLPLGYVVRKEDLAALRPGTGISPMEIDNIAGKKLVTDVSAGELVKLGHFL